jgi:hypothetical protein
MASFEAGTPGSGWLTDERREQIEIKRLIIEAENKRWKDRLAALFGAYADHYCEAGAPDGDIGPLNDIPVLVYETAVNQRWHQYPLARFVRGYVGAFKGFELPANAQRAGLVMIPAAELTAKIGAYKVTPSHALDFHRAIDSPKRICLARVRQMRIVASSQQPAGVKKEENEVCVFRKSGGVWNLRFDQTDCSVIDSVGVSYIARLLEAKGNEIDSVTLSARADAGMGMANKSAELDRRELGDMEVRSTEQQQIDTKARQEIKEHLKQLSNRRAEAELAGNAQAIEEINAETEKIQEYLKKGTGRRGRRRTFPHAEKRAANRVSQAIRRAIEKIKQQHPTLAAHLKGSLVLGASCSYRPPNSVEWRFR